MVINVLTRMVGLLLGSVVLMASAGADVVKPALVEISVHHTGRVEVVLRVSVEALLTGINGRYRNTADAPNAEAYDALRVLDAVALEARFRPFAPRLAGDVALFFDGRRTPLTVVAVDIPAAGYTKAPRISVIRLRGEAPRFADELTWYYPLRFGDNVVRVRQVNEAQQQWHWSRHQWIRADRPSEPFSLSAVYAQKPWREVVLSYVAAGFEHIVPMGLDHILFVLGIYLFSTRWRPLWRQIMMFTVAHTVTLGLSMAGYIALPARIVEPLIALSIAYVGFENAWAARRAGWDHGGMHRRRLPLVFGFGLLHGLGFSAALRDFGMPADDFLSALVAFNVGVELGQLAVVLAAFLLVGFWFRARAWYRQAVVVPGSLAIAATGVLWMFDRIAF